MAKNVQPEASTPISTIGPAPQTFLIPTAPKSANPTISTFSSKIPLPPMPKAKAPIPEPPEKKIKVDEPQKPKDEKSLIALYPNVVKLTVQCPNVPEKPDWNLKGQSLPIMLNLKDSIQRLKESIFAKLNFPISKQKITVPGFSNLKNEQSLASYLISPDVKISLSIKERGGLVDEIEFSKLMANQETPVIDQSSSNNLKENNSSNIDTNSESTEAPTIDTTNDYSYSFENIPKLECKYLFKQYRRCYEAHGIWQHSYHYGFVDFDQCTAYFTQYKACYGGQQIDEFQPKFVIESLYNDRPTTVGWIWDVRDDLPSKFSTLDARSKKEKESKSSAPETLNTLAPH
ncbi:hypothetical protein ROZALSC1DRAFT_27475 [Rozella allomycis CSF55]|uniref:Ubiquitin-like domain-containing protein n=1 Tax=Rozella allomycis (strain CSF55) TaxID=988480 RepID=A0A4P9YNJ6_ROZAC|nr:hypothetical protein ROZALSC1DRAFT_27475 [Rozella allomycis CSF55]